MSQILEVEEQKKMYPPIAEFRKMNWEQKLEAVMAMDKVYVKYRRSMHARAMKWDRCSVGEKFAWSRSWNESIGQVFDDMKDMMDATDLSLKSLGLDFPNAIGGKDYVKALEIHRRIQKHGISEKFRRRLQK